TIVQLVDGWSRVYKPILFDYFKPQVAVYGASWARDAFDPATVGPLTSLDWFNHAVSGSTPYEMRRFVESSLDDPNLKAVVLNLDTVLRPTVDVKMNYGFDEALLDTDPAGRPTRWLAARRTFAITLSGAAVGNNFEMLFALRARDSGADISEYVESYDHFDFEGRENDIERIRNVLPQLAATVPAGEGPPLSKLPMPPYAEEFARILDSLCGRDIDIHAYFTPDLVVTGRRGRGLAETLHGLELLGQRQHCRARLHYYNFNYPNGLTLDGLAVPERYSRYYRSDGHPRPTIGLLMAARMFKRPFPDGTPPEIVADFGVDLLTVDDAEARLRDQAHRVEQLLPAIQSAGVQ
ncbi:MAG: hypothetical protein HW417_718, partial [Steroidobacteraceae bacterium]|nr:hypothetical protein [Steroidobacteraceae bacterium]